MAVCVRLCLASIHCLIVSVLFVNENKNENGEKRENNDFINKN